MRTASERAESRSKATTPVFGHLLPLLEDGFSRAARTSLHGPGRETALRCAHRPERARNIVVSEVVLSTSGPPPPTPREWPRRAPPAARRECHRAPRARSWAWERPGAGSPFIPQERRQHGPPLGNARPGIHLEHPHGRVGSGRLASLANGLSQARPPDLPPLLHERLLGVSGGAERLHLQRQRIRGRRKLQNP